MDESIWVRKTSSIWTCPRTHRSTILRVCSMLPRIWLRTTQKYEMWNVYNGRAIHGQDLCYSMTEQSSWRKQKSMSTRIQYCAWEGCIQQVIQLSNGQAKWQLFEKRIILLMSFGNGWRINWIRVETFPRIHRIADSSHHPMRPGEVPHQTGKIQW